MFNKKTSRGEGKREPTLEKKNCNKKILKKVGKKFEKNYSTIFGLLASLDSNREKHSE